MWSHRQIPGWPQFFQQQVFPSVPFLVNFNCAIICQSFHLNVHVLIRQHQSLYTVRFLISAAPIIWYILGIAVLCPPLLVSIVQSFLCVLVRQSQSLHTVCFQIFAAPVKWYILGIAVLHHPWLVSIESFLKASSSSSSVWIQPFHLLRIICFWNFSRHMHTPPLKTPLAPSPASFNHFWKHHPPVIHCLLLAYFAYT